MTKRALLLRMLVCPAAASVAVAVAVLLASKAYATPDPLLGLSYVAYIVVALSGVCLLVAYSLARPIPRWAPVSICAAVGVAMLLDAAMVIRDGSAKGWTRLLGLLNDLFGHWGPAIGLIAFGALFLALAWMLASAPARR